MGYSLWGHRAGHNWATKHAHIYRHGQDCRKGLWLFIYTVFSWGALYFQAMWMVCSLRKNKNKATGLPSTRLQVFCALPGSLSLVHELGISQVTENWGDWAEVRDVYTLKACYKVNSMWMWVLWVRKEQQRALITIVNPPYQKRRGLRVVKLCSGHNSKMRKVEYLIIQKYYSTFCFNRHTPEVFLVVSNS